MPSWPAGGEIRPAEHRRRDERLARLAMPRLELAHGRYAVRAHHEMDRALASDSRTTRRARCNVAHVRVRHEHRDDDVATYCEIRDRCRHARAGGGHRRGSRSDDVEHTKVVTRVEYATRHSLAHPAKADETYAHDEPFGSENRSRTVSLVQTTFKPPRPLVRGSVLVIRTSPVKVLIR